MFYYRLLFIIFYGYSVNASLTDYFTGVREILGFTQNGDDQGGTVIDQRVPYEVSIADEKFIHEAAKLTGVALSELDTCQHRVVFKLQTSCHKMNDEQLAKLAVMLLNCQSAVEGRRIYPCTDSMSIKDCTTDMDADTWNSYHLMSNRARAVCYSVRQLQFRGLTETTVNRLMDASREHLVSLNRLSKSQEDLHNMAEESLDIISQGQKNLLNQQQDLERVQFQGQLAIEDNIKRVIDEKQLIAESHKQLVDLTESVRHKIEEASKQLDAHQQESRSNHEELLDDLISIQNKAHVIFQRIEDSSKLLLQQSEEAHHQYQATLTQLSEVNATIHALVSLVNSTREALEERLAWLTAALGGTDVAVDRLYMIVWHGLFLLIAMIACSFLRAEMFARIIVATSPPLNLVASLQQSSYALDFVGLISTIGVLVLVQNIISYIMTLWNTDSLPKPLKWNQVSGLQNNSQPPPSIRNIDTYTVTNSLETSSTTQNVNSEEWDDFNGYSVPTSPLLRNESNRSRSRTPLHLNGGVKSTCSAKTRLGTPCKLSSLPGREFCHRHLAGSSVMGS